LLFGTFMGSDCFGIAGGDVLFFPQWYEGQKGKDVGGIWNVWDLLWEGER